MSAELIVERTPIDGLLVLELPVNGDSRGWFKENWQREKMVARGLPDFAPVQQNMSFNESPGVTRGVHAEPWDKLVSIGVGRVFGAWVDLRPGSGFGTVFTTELTPGRAVFVPRGVGNAFQTLDAGTLYSYLVNDHWSAAAKSEYTFVNLADPALGIDWPIDLERAILSDADREHPFLGDVVPMLGGRTLVIGSDGQLGLELRKTMDPQTTRFLTRAHVDLTRPASIEALDLQGVTAVINAAAFTQVDAAETPEGRALAWAANASAVGHLAVRCAAAGVTLVHVSSDYVFDGSSAQPYTEGDALSPLGVYGQSKAAGDLAAACAKKHYVVRTSWVVGDGKNFLSTMASLADRGIKPTVVDDQRGRLSSTRLIAEGIQHLLASEAPYGIYNVTGGGEPKTWAEIAAVVYAQRGRPGSDVIPVSTQMYAEGRTMAPRPKNSVLNLDKIYSTGFHIPDHLEIISEVLANIN